MNAQDLRSLLEQPVDKFSLTASLETLGNCEITYEEFLDLISDFFNNESG